MKKIIFLFFLFFTSCATHRVLITSDPPGGDVYINNRFSGKTPVVLNEKFDPFEEYSLEITLSGHKLLKRTLIANRLFGNNRALLAGVSTGLLFSSLFSRNDIAIFSASIIYPVFSLLTGSLDDHYHFLLVDNKGQTKISDQMFYKNMNTLFSVNYKTKRFIDSNGNGKIIVENYRPFSMEVAAGKIFSMSNDLMLLSYGINYYFDKFSSNVGVGAISSRINNSEETGIYLSLMKIEPLFNGYNNRKIDFSYGVGWENIFTLSSFNDISLKFRLDLNVTDISLIFIESDLGALFYNGYDFYFKPKVGFRVLF